MAKTKAKSDLEASLNTPAAPRFAESSDRQVGDPLLALRKILHGRLQSNYLKSLASKQHQGRVMRIVKDVLLAENGLWHELTNGSSDVAPRATVFYVYVPEIHGQILPKPDSYDDPVIDFFPQFVGPPGIELPALGAVVEIEFRDYENYDLGVYLGLAKDKPIAPLKFPKDERTGDAFRGECVGRSRASQTPDTSPKPVPALMGDANPGTRAPIFVPPSITAAKVEVNATGIKGKGIFIDNVSQETLGAPAEAADKAFAMGLSWVAIRAIYQNPYPVDADPEKSFFTANKQIHGQINFLGYSSLLDRDTIKKYSEEFIKKGILVYLSGHPWVGMDIHDYTSAGPPVLGFADYMVSTAKHVNAVGVINDADLGYSTYNKDYPTNMGITFATVQNSSQTFISKAKQAGLHVGLSSHPFPDHGEGQSIPWTSLGGYDFYISKTRMPRPDFSGIKDLAYGVGYFKKSWEHYAGSFPGKQIIFCLGAPGATYDRDLWIVENQAYLLGALPAILGLSPGAPHAAAPGAGYQPGFGSEEELKDYLETFGGSVAGDFQVGKNYNTAKKSPERMRDEAVWAGSQSEQYSSEAVIWWDWKNLNDSGEFNEESMYQGVWTNGPEGAKTRWDIVKSFGYFAEVESLLLQTEGIKFIPQTTKVSGRTFKGWKWTKGFFAAEPTAGLEQE